MFYFVKRGGEKGRFGCSPGCFLLSVMLSIGLTVFLNLLIWLFNH